MRFRINNLRDLKLSQNARLILESVFISSVEDTSLEVKHNSNVILRLKIQMILNARIFSHCFKSTEVTGVTVNSLQIRIDFIILLLLLILLITLYLI